MKNVAEAFSRWLPSSQAPATTPEPVVAGAQKVTARIDIQVADQCPVCKATMTKADAHGLPVYVCHDHRVVLPQPD